MTLLPNPYRVGKEKCGAVGEPWMSCQGTWALALLCHWPMGDFGIPLGKDK